MFKYLMVRVFAASTLLLINFCLSAAGTGMPDFQSDGRISDGTESVQMTSQGQIRLTVDNNEVILIDQQMSIGKIKWTYPPYFENKRFKVFPQEKKCLFTGKVPLSKEKGAGQADFSLNLKLLNDGSIDVDRKLKIPEGIPTRYDNTFFIIPFHLLSGQTIKVNDKSLHIKESNAGDNSNGLILKHSKDVKTIELFPDDADKRILINIAECRRTFLRLSKSRRGKQFILGLMSSNGDVRFTIKLSGKVKRKTAKSNTIINFRDCDNLEVPNYQGSVNLIQNPSFDQGLNYYQYRSYAKTPGIRYSWYYKLDNSTAKFGKTSVLMRALKQIKDPVPLGTFIIPVEANKDYTFSFYAKSNNRDAGLVLRSLSARHPQFAQFQGKGHKYFSLTKQWKRYSVNLKNPNTGLALMFQAKLGGNSSSDEAKIWIDGLQLEKGTQLSEFTMRPVSARFLTSAKDNFLDAGKPVNPELTISTSRPAAAGKVKIEVKDFFGKEVWNEQYEFKAKAGSNTRISLPTLEKALKNKQGIFIVKVIFKLDDGSTDYDFFRFAILKYLDNKFKNKNIFAFCLRYLLCRPDIPAIMERFKYIGWGSANYGTYGNDIARLLKDNNIKYFGDHMVSKRKANGGMVIDGKVMMRDINNLRNVTPEIQKKFEDLCYEKAKLYPYINTWCFDGECATGMMSGLMENIENFARLLIATYKGVKRANPQAQVLLTGGPCNMMPQGGSRLVAKYIDAVKGRVKFDAVAIHPYRATPEDPDLDSDAKYFLDMLDKKGYGDVPVHWNEGMHFPQYNVPAWGLNPYRGNSNDHFYAGTISYDMGWGEKISAAYYARGWLVALKYQNRVEMFNGWQHRETFMDIDLTPFSVQKVTNTLGNILGNAVFKKDIRFAANSRCYVFEDELKRPVAVMWSYYPKVDRNKARPPEVVLKFSGYAPEFIDLMGTTRKLSPDKQGAITMPLTPFPVFIRGKAGSLNTFCVDIAKTALKDARNIFIKVTAKPLAGNRMELTFFNPLTNDFTGNAVFKINNKNYNEQLKLKGMTGKSVIVPLSHKPNDGKISRIDIPCVISDKKGDKSTQNISMDFFCARELAEGKTIKVDGNLNDWAGIPEIKVVNSVVNKIKAVEDPEKIAYPGDFAASFRVTWDTRNLYIAATVVDDVFCHDKMSRPSQRWNNDCLQLYLDTLCDAATKKIKGFDTNDYNYDFFPNEREGTLTAFRRFAPEQQAAGGLYAPKPNEVEPNIKTAFKRTKNGYIYEIAIPAKYIAPMRLEPDSIVGFGIFFSDRDKAAKRKKGSFIKRSLTVTPPGTGCYMNPHLYPVMLLVK